MITSGEGIREGERHFETALLIWSSKYIYSQFFIF